jgi:hypothetical protein
MVGKMTFWADFENLFGYFLQKCPGGGIYRFL